MLLPWADESDFAETVEDFGGEVEAGFVARMRYVGDGAECAFWFGTEAAAATVALRGVRNFPVEAA